MQKVWAIHAFEAQEPEDIRCFEPGQEIIVLEKDDGYNDGWWKGTTVDGKYTGLFPANFVSASYPALVAAQHPSEAQEELAPDIESHEQAAALVSSSPSDPISRSKRSPYEWSVDDVLAWLSELSGFQPFLEAFRVNDMDGLALLSPYLDINSLKELGIHVLERRLTLMSEIAKLKKKADFMALSPSPDLLRIMSSPSISSDAISKKSPHRLDKKRSHTVHITPKIPQNIQTLADVMALDISGAFVKNSCDFQGYLYKRGGKAHWSWKRRWFVLKHMTLWYFKTAEPSAKCLGLIVLPSYQILPAENTNVQNSVFTFLAAHPDARTYWFRAESVCDMTSWMNAMVRASLGLPTDLEPEKKENVVAADDGLKPLSKTAPLSKPKVPSSEQLDSLVAQLKELQMRKKAPPVVPFKPSPLSELEKHRRDTIIKTLSLKSSDEYVDWLNSVLSENSSLAPVKHLHLELSDGIYLSEFLLRLAANNYERRYGLALKLPLDRMFETYRAMIIQRPTNRSQMTDNLQVCWRIVEREIDSDNMSTWTPNKLEPVNVAQSESITKRLEELQIQPEGIYQGNLEQILLFFNELDRVLVDPSAATKPLPQ